MFHPRILLLTIFLALFLPFNNAFSIALSDGIEVDHIVAIVNDSLVTNNELTEEIIKIQTSMKEAGKQPPPRDAIEKQVLDKLINRRLQLDKAESLGISVSPDMLATAIGNIARSNNLTLSEMRQSLEQEGLSFTAFRKQIERQILLSRLKNQEIINKINVSDAEIDSLLKQDKQIGKKNAQYLLQHILIGLPDGATSTEIATAQDKALSIVDQLRSGAEFSQLALLHSSGRNALEGGSLGWLKNNQLPSLFADIVAGMSKGEISQPIRSSSGFHIIKLADLKGSQQQFITQTWARHILINTGEMVSDDDARTRLEQLFLRIEDGDDFARLARSHSDDKGSAIKGGELGWVSPGSVVKKFQEEMDKLQPGELSKPFRTEFGWHIVQVLERRQHDNSEQVLRSEARKIITDRKAKDATDLYLRRLRDEAYIEIRLDEE
jgi:peptidyl-prolyl cis-trans isomerase SurA